MRHVRHFTVSFDYMAEEVAKRTGDPAITRVVERFAAMALLGITASVMSGALQTKPWRQSWNTSRWRTFIEPIDQINN
jgi:hypothetical protein